MDMCVLTIRVTKKTKQYLTASAAKLGVTVADLLRPIIEESGVSTIESMVELQKEARAAKRQSHNRVR